jgi:pimeloyl-ACP methyl ester carboxylesterase
MLLRMLRTGRASSVDGTQIAFSEWGQANAPPVVLIHGWLFSRGAFERQVQGELAERCRVVAYDLRGHGESDKPEHASAYADGNLWAADLDCVLQAVGMQRPVLAGWSLGGRVAVHYVFARGAESVSGLNVIAARVLQPAGAAISTPLGASKPAPGSFVRACVNQPLSPEEERPFLEAAKAVPLVARQGASSWHIDYGRYFDGLKNLRVLVTHGDSDALTSPQAAENIAQRLRGKLSIYPNCGHMPFWENPLRFNRELAAFATQS